MSDAAVEISAVVAVSERQDDIADLYRDYKDALATLNRSFEIIVVLDGQFPGASRALKSLRDAGESVKVIQLSQSFGEAAAFTVGFRNSSGGIVLSLPSYYQADPGDIPKLLAALDDSDIAIGRRWPRVDSRFKRLQTAAFHKIINSVADSNFSDLGCGMRAFKRHVLEEIPLYGDQHRFLPVLAEKRGFRVTEVDVAQSPHDAAPEMYRVGVYVRRILDILTIFFLVKFTKKPLRFFGLIGSATFALSGLVLVYVIFQRLFFGVGLADRPALLLSSLFVVLGVQLFALGLIGELIIFTHARDMEEYTIDQILE